MANEAEIRGTLKIVKDNVDYVSRPGFFTADIATAKGPSPGVVECSTGGTLVDLDQLSTPALCRIKNLDSTNYVEIGIWNGTDFYPFIELLPGDSYIMRLSRNLQDGLLGTASNRLRGRANTASVSVLIECFDA